ncbi:4Fe-4S binding protein [Sulfurimonas sp. HSL-3221]|uniref:4Fe-4S binding protein n=1 Tax=Sulfurimonadaceae TaxID=2771471 RepID=UPI001E3CE23F|nr:4Fe-4S binding protein [Sulfurimonas sp. HSL-3221]UFS63741.1 4Fe-4S binding protein [Sulfurimonas sp. HSL-3221]
MVDHIKRDRNDLYGMPLLGYLFKNQRFLFLLRLAVTALFFYAIALGFAVPGKENLYTPALFWGIFWSLFIVVSLPTFGRIFCGICPHRFLGHYLTKFGLKKRMPKWLENRFIGVTLLMVGWWGVYYSFPSAYHTPFGSAVLFTVMTLLSFAFYLVYKEMSYCKYICPIGTLTRAYEKLSFTWLGTNQSACSECKTFDCAKACTHGLSPFNFDKKNSMGDCTLCMDCSAACEAVSFRLTKPSFSLFSHFKIEKAEVWAYILIVAAIPITMAFHHGMGRSAIADEFIWAKTAAALQGIAGLGGMDTVGLFAFLYAVLFSVVITVAGMFVASKILQKEYSTVFYTLGYAFAPLFIFGSLSHTLEMFFVSGMEKIVDGFAYGFGVQSDFTSPASRKDAWVHLFSYLRYVGVAWALVILYKRIRLIEAKKRAKILAFPFAASLIIFFVAVNLYRGYILDTYGRAQRGHHSAPAEKPSKNAPQAMRVTAEPAAEHPAGRL